MASTNAGSESHNELKRWFFEGYIQFHPEEGTTLGVDGGADRLRDHSVEALLAEREWLERAASRLSVLPTEPTQSGSAADLDRRWMKRLVDVHLHLWDELWCGVDWAMYPYNLTQVQLVHATTDAERSAANERLGAMPTFLQQHQEIVADGLRRGVAPDQAMLSFLVDLCLPRAETGLREMDLPNANAAAEAIAAHRAWAQSEVTPVAARRLGEQELSWRLEHMLGVTDPDVDSVIQRARDELALVQDRLVSSAAILKPSANITTMEAAREFAMELQKETLPAHTDVAAFYRDLVHRSRSRCTELGLFDIPDDYAIGMGPLPPGFELVVGAANWPAPLKNRSKLGPFLCDVRPSVHPVVWAEDLAVHEGLPGPHLQSFLWQRRFADDPAPVRFLVVHDQVAIPRQFWSPMVNIEGWAVYAEELMRRNDFFSPVGELFVWMAHGVRSARVVCDLSLHSGRMTPEQAKRFLMDEVCLKPDHAGKEVHRYLQVPLQASTYLLGRLAIEDLVSEARQHAGTDFDIARFHHDFLEYGPIDPWMIRESLLA